MSLQGGVRRLRQPQLMQSSAAGGALRVAAVIGLGLALSWLGMVGMRYGQRGLPDFEFFYKAAAWLAEHGGLDRGFDRRSDGTLVPRGSIEWYLPFVSRALLPLGYLRISAASAIWLGLNLLALVTTLRLLLVHGLGVPRRDWPVAAVPLLALLALFWYWEFRLNQINNFTLLLMTACLVHVQQGKRTAAGLWLGLAVLIKLTPALLLAWLALKRQWRAVTAALLTIVVAGPLSDAIVFGPTLTTEYYRSWYEQAVQRGSPSGLILSQREMDWRNQALGAVLSRWLHTTNWSTTFDNDPRVASDPTPRFINVASLPREHVASIVTLLAAGSIAGLLWLVRRPAARLSQRQLLIEWSLFLLAMLWLMPVMRRYHLIWAVPAAAILLQHVWQLGMRAWTGWFAAVALTLMAAGQLVVLPMPSAAGTLVEAMGMFLLVVLVLAGAAGGVLRAERALAARPLPAAASAGVPGAAPAEPGRLDCDSVPAHA
jgi:hypothetical protein